MTTTYKWQVVQLDRKTEDGFVTTAHWTVTATDDDFSAYAYGTCGFSGELITPYADVTMAEVLDWWCTNGVDKDAVDAEGKPKYQAMQASTSEVIADLVAELQALRARVASLESSTLQ